MGKKGANAANPTATMGETLKVPTVLDVASVQGRVLTMVEVDPATENPALLDAIRYVLPSHNRGLRLYYVDGDGERGGLSLGRLRFHVIWWGFGLSRVYWFLREERLLLWHAE